MKVLKNYIKKRLNENNFMLNEKKKKRKKIN